MRKVQRGELLGLSEYEQVRDRFRARIITEKRRRRLVVSEEVSAVFENHYTVLFQIQEMLWTERIFKKAAVLHELETYNELIPNAQELSSTMFVEILDKEVRERRLVELAGLEACLALEIDGVESLARNETRGVLPDRTTAVHYLKFPLGESAARLAAKRADREASGVFFIINHPKLQVRKELPSAMIHALAEDLTED
jgi:hypothetical protein